MLAVSELSTPFHSSLSFPVVSGAWGEKGRAAAVRAPVEPEHLVGQLKIESFPEKAYLYMICLKCLTRLIKE